MNSNKPMLVIVPETKGAEALASIAGITTVLLPPGEGVPTEAQQAEVLVVGPAESQQEVDDALRQIAHLPHLKLLQTLGQGTEQWNGRLPESVTVSTARGAHGGSTAELVMASLLALVRDIPYYIQNQHSHVWQGRRAQTLMNMSVLIYGASDLGRNVQRRLIPFGAQVTMVGTHKRDDVIDNDTARGLLPTTDIVVMALPLTPNTEHMVDADFLAQLPDGAIIVNAGRGGLIDQNALLRKLNTGRLRAVLDVVSVEPLPASDPLWDAPNVLLTPHVGGNTIGADDRAWQIAAQCIRDFRNDQLPD